MREKEMIEDRNVGILGQFTAWLDFCVVKTEKSTPLLQVLFFPAGLNMELTCKK